MLLCSGALLGVQWKRVGCGSRAWAYVAHSTSHNVAGQVASRLQPAPPVRSSIARATHNRRESGLERLLGLQLFGLLNMVEFSGCWACFHKLIPTIFKGNNGYMSCVEISLYDGKKVHFSLDTSTIRAIHFDLHILKNRHWNFCDLYCLLMHWLFKIQRVLVNPTFSTPRSMTK